MEDFTMWPLSKKSSVKGNRTSVKDKERTMGFWLTMLAVFLGVFCALEIQKRLTKIEIDYEMGKVAEELKVHDAP